eukprot:364298-Chlamydomonas_euryale.AAC.5
MVAIARHSGGMSAWRHFASMGNQCGSIARAILPMDGAASKSGKIFIFASQIRFHQDNASSSIGAARKAVWRPTCGGLRPLKRWT